MSKYVAIIVQRTQTALRVSMLSFMCRYREHNISTPNTACAFSVCILYSLNHPPMFVRLFVHKNLFYCLNCINYNCEGRI